MPAVMVTRHICRRGAIMQMGVHRCLSVFITVTVFYCAPNLFAQSKFAPDSIRIHVHLTSTITNWHHEAPGLKQWPDSKYAALNTDYNFSFHPAYLFNLSIGIGYGKFDFLYDRSEPGIAGNYPKQFVSDYEFRVDNGQELYQVSDLYLNYVKHQISLVYKTKSNWKLGLALAASTTDIQPNMQLGNINFPDYMLSYKMMRIGFVCESVVKIMDKLPALYIYLNYAPYARIHYYYQSDAANRHGLAMQKEIALNGHTGTARFGIPLIRNRGFQVIPVFTYSRSQCYDRLFETDQQGLSMIINLNF